MSDSEDFLGEEWRIDVQRRAAMQRERAKTCSRYDCCRFVCHECAENHITKEYKYCPYTGLAIQQPDACSHTTNNCDCETPCETLCDAKCPENIGKLFERTNGLYESVANRVDWVSFRKLESKLNQLTEKVTDAIDNADARLERIRSLEKQMNEMRFTTHRHENAINDLRLATSESSIAALENEIRLEGSQK